MGDFPNAGDFIRLMGEEVMASNRKLSLEAVQRPGSDVNSMIAGAAAGMDEISAQLAGVAAGSFLSSSTRGRLDRFLFDRYQLPRKPQANARGTVEFSTTALAPATFTIPANTTLSTSDGKQFVTVEATTFLIGTTGPYYATVRSVLAGAKQQAGKGTIKNIVSSITGKPSDLVVTNSLATAGSDDVEVDDAYRDRGRGFWSTQQRGTNRAIAERALRVPGVQRAIAMDVIDASGRPARMVELIIADAFTDALVNQNINPPTYQTQSNALAAAVFDALEDHRGGGTYVQVVVGQVVIQPIVLNLRFRAGANVQLASQMARALTTAKVNSLRPGDTFQPNTLITPLLRQVQGLEIFGDEVVSPTNDVIPSVLQVIRTSLHQVSVNVTSGNLSGSASLDQLYLQGNV